MKFFSRGLFDLREKDIPDDGEWHHFTAVRTRWCTRVYIDGQQRRLWWRFGWARSARSKMKLLTTWSVWGKRDA